MTSPRCAFRLLMGFAKKLNLPSIPPTAFMRYSFLALLAAPTFLVADETPQNVDVMFPTTRTMMRSPRTSGVVSATLMRTNGTRSNYSARANTPAAHGIALLVARAAARVGDTIAVGPGAYRVQTSLAKNGVNWHFEVGAIITRVDESSDAIWDDHDTPMTFSVTGYGDFTRITGSNLMKSWVVRVRNSDSVISIQGRDFTAIGPATGGTDASVLRLEGGKIFLEGRDMSAKANRNGYAIWWLNGSGTVRAAKITSDYVSVGGSVTTTPTGDFHVAAEQIETAIFNGGNQSTAAMWIRCNTLKDILPDGGAVSISGSGRIYIEAQKVFGFIYTISFEGLLYVRAEKHVATISGMNGLGSFLNIDGGEIFYDITHVDPNGYGGDTFAINEGILHWDRGSMVGLASTNGISISGGTVRLNGVTLNTSANSATSPIQKSGGTVILGSGSVLIAHSSADSIFAANPESVKVYGEVVTNRKAHSNVTIQVGKLLVDPDVK